MKTFTIVIFILFQFLPVNVFSSSIIYDYDVSERCGKRCEEYFKSTILPKVLIPDDFKYENHYNKKMNKCFIMIISRDLRGNKSMKLIDVNENKEYGEFFYYEGKLEFCNVLEKNCKSEKEWDLLVKPYMEE